MQIHNGLVFKGFQDKMKKKRKRKPNIKKVWKYANDKKSNTRYCSLCNRNYLGEMCPSCGKIN
jgi:hypothetical protein